MSGDRDPRLRVLVLSHELSLSGAPRLASEMVRALARDFDLRTVSAVGGALEPSFGVGGPLDILAWAPGWLSTLPHPLGTVAAKAVRRLRAPLVGERARRWRPDVVYANSAASITLIPRLGLRGVPTLLYVHELAMAIGRLTEQQRHMVRSVPAGYVAVSRVVAKELIEGQGIAPDRVVVVPPLIDAQRIVALAGGPAAEATADPQSTVVIGGAGNPHWTKGVELWLLMARAVLDRLGPGAVRFRWVGVHDNEAGAEFRMMIGKLGLGQHVDLVAETANPYLEFRRFGVFAQTSWEESASLVTLENMSLGVPVVCFRDSGGPAEQVGAGGWVIDEFSPTAMAATIVKLVQDPAQRSRIVHEARARVEATNAPGVVAPQFVAALVDVASRRQMRAIP